jgi:hypothetical protein
MTARERAIFNCFADTVVAPEPLLPPVAQTDAADFYAEWLALAPRLNAVALRAAVTGLDLAPLALGFRHRLRRLDRGERVEVLRRMEKARSAPARQEIKALKGIAFLCYYGDDGLLKPLGYDADANVARAQALREAEGRP